MIPGQVGFRNREITLITEGCGLMGEAIGRILSAAAVRLEQGHRAAGAVVLCLDNSKNELGPGKPGPAIKLGMRKDQAFFLSSFLK